MIQKLIVNAAFLVVGYYIGKEVAKKQHADLRLDEKAESALPTSSEDQDLAAKGLPTIN